MKVGQKTVPQLVSVPQRYISALGLSVFCFSVQVVHLKLDALKADCLPLWNSKQSWLLVDY